MRHSQAKGYYQATAIDPTKRAPLDGDARVDVAIVGAGFTGLSTAIHLAKLGFKPWVIEAETIGFGASGRNGGQISSGQRRPQDELECRYGFDAAQQLWQLAQEAKTLIKSLVAEHDIECEIEHGLIEAAHNARHARELARYPGYMARHYDYHELHFLEAEAFAAKLKSPAYRQGIFDAKAFHLHPLKYALGLAKAAESLGVRIIENTRVTRVRGGQRPALETASGHIEADQIVLACNGYIDDLDPSLASRIMPLNNFIIATEPLGELAGRLIPSRAAVCDTRHVINYFRLSSDGRLLFGGGETYGFSFPDDIANFVRPHMVGVFPELADMKIDYAWGGTLAITRPRLPLFAKPDSHIWTACGYSGHGISIATLAGRILADAISGQMQHFDVMAKLDPKPFPGGTTMRLPLLWLAMLWFKLKDRL